MEQSVILIQGASWCLERKV